MPRATKMQRATTGRQNPVFFVLRRSVFQPGCEVDSLGQQEQNRQSQGKAEQFELHPELFRKSICDVEIKCAAD